MCGAGQPGQVLPPVQGSPAALPRALPYLTMKSKLEPASMSRPSNVEMAPSVTGANVCSRARAARRFRLPWEVRKPWGNKAVLELLLGQPWPAHLCPQGSPMPWPTEGQVNRVPGSCPGHKHESI